MVIFSLSVNRPFVREQDCVKSFHFQGIAIKLYRIRTIVMGRLDLGFVKIARELFV